MYSTDRSVPAKAHAVGLFTGSLILSGNNVMSTLIYANMLNEMLQADVAPKYGLLQWLVQDTHTHSCNQILHKNLAT